MNYKSSVISVTALLSLSACADLGFGDFPLADAGANDAGPVLISDIEDTTAITEASNETAPLASAPRLPVITTAAVSTSPKSPPPVVASAPAEAAEEEVPMSTASNERPTDARPGECFARVTIPAETVKQTRQVLVSAASTKKETIPATYKTVTEQVLVTPATTRTETIAATYKTETRRVPVDASANASDDVEYETVTERVLVTPEQTKEVEVPARYETVTERVKVRDAYTEWRESAKVYAIGAEALGGTILANQVSSTGVMCLVEIPAEFKTETKRVLVEEATTRTETIPAVYETVTRRVPVGGDAASDDSGEQEFREVTVRVIDQPAQTRTVPVPAVYKTETKRVIDTPAQTREVPVPAVYREEVSERIVTPAKTEWARVICKENATPDFVKSLQRALQARGLYKGPIDGLIGPGTRGAIKAYQDDGSDVLTFSSAKALGLSV
jgi:regulator of extracellular matrix RemA (YlzA/DUF370 family)